MTQIISRIRERKIYTAVLLLLLAADIVAVIAGLYSYLFIPAILTIVVAYRVMQS